MRTSFPCPICRKSTPREGNPHRPFCSERCRMIDLGNWASERYRVPGPPLDESDADGLPTEDDEEGG